MIYDETSPNQRGTIGGKANGLYRLQGLGLAVPPFVVIPAETFDPVLRELPAEGVSADQIRDYLLAFALPEPDRTSLERTLAGWGFPGRAVVVVRSSVADEDGTVDAFAGLMDSFLNLTTGADVLTAISRCAASAYSDRAMAYRTQKSLTHRPRPAVIVQQQVTPTTSGVIFTTFPDYPQELAIHATYGFGEGLVSGQLDADEFYWLKQTGQPNRQIIADKTHQLTIAPDTGLLLTDILTDNQRVPCLTDAQLAELFSIGTRLERALGGPQDVEFVVSAGVVFVVQTRPVTQAIPEVIVYDNANIQESYCGVTTPLTFSFASRAYATVYRQTMHTLGLPEAVIAAHEPVVSNLLGLVKGRIYYHINNWYRGLLLLPSFGQNKADMERMMGLDEPVDFVTDQAKTTAEKLRMLPGLLVNLARLLWKFARLHRQVPGFLSDFQAYTDQFYQQPMATRSRAELLAERDRLDRALLHNWTTPIINDFRVMMTNGRAGRLLRRVGIADPTEFLSRYLSNDAQIESTQPVRAMYRLAAEARQQPDLRALILTAPDDLHGQIKSSFSAFYQSVSQFIDQYGDRTVGELKLETVTMRVMPGVFYRYLSNYLHADTLTDLLADTDTNLHTQAVAELADRLAAHPGLLRYQLTRTLGQLQRAIQYRETMRLARTRLFGMYRTLYRAIGNTLVQDQHLTNPTDVFYLTEAEIAAIPLPNPSPVRRDLCPDAEKLLLTGEWLGRGVAEKDTSALKSLIINRRQEFVRYERDDVPGRVTVPSPPIPTKLTPDIGPANELHGTGCTPGVVTGEVIVIMNPGDDLDVRGRVVCALRTDPGWAVLFPMCRAVLIERGSSLSHSVILLRELGLPTIINIPGLTKTLRTGQTVTLDGSTGHITILSTDHA